MPEIQTYLPLLPLCLMCSRYQEGEHISEELLLVKLGSCLPQATSRHLMCKPLRMAPGDWPRVREHSWIFSLENTKALLGSSNAKVWGYRTPQQAIWWATRKAWY